MQDIDTAEKKALDVVQRIKGLSMTLALSESCTAGLISSLLANIPGASAVLWGSYVCYTQEAKVSMLGLDNKRLTAFGLVSRETVSSMAEMTLKKSGADIAVSVTGLAGPDGDGSPVPVGTVWIAAYPNDGNISTREFHFEGSRNAVRLQAAIAALDLLQSALNGRSESLDIKEKK
jgi:PncC family amidohydrolase